jgi:hypothetical protein
MKIKGQVGLAQDRFDLREGGFMKTLLLAVAIVIAVPALGQDVEHAPTVAQCQADQRLWLSKLEANHGLDDVTVPTLVAWEHEMIKCEAVDPPNRLQYYNTWGEATAIEAWREHNFIKRHGLDEQFLAEDAAGKR